MSRAWWTAGARDDDRALEALRRIRSPDDAPSVFALPMCVHWYDRSISRSHRAFACRYDYPPAPRPRLARELDISVRHLLGAQRACGSSSRVKGSRRRHPRASVRRVTIVRPSFGSRARRIRLGAWIGKLFAGYARALHAIHARAVAATLLRAPSRIIGVRVIESGDIRERQTERQL